MLVKKLTSESIETKKIKIFSLLFYDLTILFTTKITIHITFCIRYTFTFINFFKLYFFRFFVQLTYNFIALFIFLYFNIFIYLFFCSTCFFVSSLLGLTKYSFSSVMVLSLLKKIEPFVRSSSFSIIVVSIKGNELAFKRLPFSFFVITTTYQKHEKNNTTKIPDFFHDYSLLLHKVRIAIVH